jgi:hypothetical protein
MAAIKLSDLFEMTGGLFVDDDGNVQSGAQGGEILLSGLHLMGARHEGDDHILNCKRCGSLVPYDSADIHLAWHQKLEEP